MKTRVGFISNSSSTSFIVPCSQKEEALKCGLKLISVSVIKKAFHTISDVGGDFIFDYSWVLNDLKKLNDNDFITEPFDRDMAYESGINDMYGKFMEDL